MAWTTKNGALNAPWLSDAEYWRLFNRFFSSASKTTTYKFALLKAILDNLFNNEKVKEGERIFYSDIFAKFAESFWNLVIKYGLRQKAVSSDGKTTKIEQIFHESVRKEPVLGNIEFAMFEERTRKALIGKVRQECCRYVLGALYGDFSGNLYAFDLSGDSLVLAPGAYEFLLKYKVEVEKLNYYYWAQYLERINDESVLLGILGKLEVSLPQREPLSVYRKILSVEFEENNCFYCGCRLSGLVHVDHFIPWSFVKEDKLWNFVLSCPKCNLKKSNILPEKRLIGKINSRNRNLLAHSNEFIEAQFKGYTKDLVENLWHYALFAGFRVMGEDPR